MTRPVDLKSHSHTVRVINEVEKKGPQIILASASPRRKMLLERAGFSLDICPVDVDESHQTHETVVDYVGRLARDKARAAALRVEWSGQLALIAADTSVWIDECAPLGKPGNEADAVATLTMLSGRAHFVTTAFCVLSPADVALESVGLCTTAVTMRELDAPTIRAYVGTGEPFGKAGSYAIQGLASTFIHRINGSWDNVVGLPVGEVIEALRAAAIIESYPWVMSE